MWESDACADRMLSFVSFRYHLLFFYRPVTPQVHGTNDSGQPEPPMLQKAMMAQRRMDAIGRSISEELRVLFLAYRHRATALEYVVHPMIIQSPFTFVPVTYMSPAIPHVIVYASVCKAWKESIDRASCWQQKSARLSSSSGSVLSTTSSLSLDPRVDGRQVSLPCRSASRS